MIILLPLIIISKIHFNINSIHIVSFIVQTQEDFIRNILKRENNKQIKLKRKYNRVLSHFQDGSKALKNNS